ncbi:hypothetical protein FOPG_19153, partial [Fusarium oxysporum f. sp. conglutinans race 2 54008]
SQKRWRLWSNWISTIKYYSAGSVKQLFDPMPPSSRIVDKSIS